MLSVKSTIFAAAVASTSATEIFDLGLDFQEIKEQFAGFYDAEELQEMEQFFNDLMAQFAIEDPIIEEP